MRAGGTPPVDDPEMWSDSGLPWIAITDMTRAARVVNTDRHVSPNGVRAKRLPVGEPETLLFAMYASVGALAVSDVRATWNQAILGIDPVDGRADIRFVRYWLEHLRPTFAAISRSNTQDNLNAEQVGGFPFPTLTEADQRAIADFLDTETTRLDSLIAKKRRMEVLLDERWAAELDQMLAGARESTTLARLTPDARPIMYGIVLPGPDLDAGRPIVKGGNVRNDGLRGPLCNTSHSIESRYARSRLRSGDLVVVIRGAGAGRIGRVPEWADMANLTQDVARVAPAPGVDGEWLRLILQSRRVQDQLSISVGGAAITGINIWDLKRVRVPSVPLPDQLAAAQLAKRVESRIRRQQHALHRQIELLVEKRQALTTAAVTGELDIPGVAA